MALIVGSSIFKFLTVFLLIRFAHSDTETKSNVAFVIDDTGSMNPVIKQVKEKAAKMFKTIYESKRTMIGDFILITFNDFDSYEPNYSKSDVYGIGATKELITTKNSDEFLRALGSIDVDGGGDCPEYCLSGIKRAIERSNPNSFIYVFTDASPKDYQLEKTVENLAQLKSIQITFLLVDVLNGCVLDDTSYKNLAFKTSGEVFSLNQNDINKIIDYISHTMQSPLTPLKKEKITPGINTMNVTIDDDMKNVTITANVPPKAYVEISVTGPNGDKVPTDTLITLRNTKVVIISNPEAGNYLVTVDTDGTGETSVKAVVSIDFTYGFSLHPPRSMKNTQTSPVPDEESYLAVQLKSVGLTDAVVETIKILDLYDKELRSMPAIVVNRKEMIFMSSPFRPVDAFKIKIIALDKKTGNRFERIYRTPIRPQPQTQRPPVIDKDIKTENALKGTKAVIPCRIIKGTPKATIAWEFKRRHAIEFVKLPEVGHEVHIDSVDIEDTGVYKCTAKNVAGIDFHEIELIVTDEPNVVSNKVLIAKIGDVVTITCKVTGEPSPVVNWIRNGKNIVPDHKYKIYSDHSLRFRTTLDDEGNYTCHAKNSYGEHSQHASLQIYDPVKIEIPEESNLHFDIGTDVVLSCNASGIPQPQITWHFFSLALNVKPRILPFGKETLSIPKIQLKNAGYYRCFADNGYDSSQITYEIHVDVPVEIEKPVQTEFNIVENGLMLKIPCKATGYPKPKVSWLKNHEVLNMGDAYGTNSKDTLIIMKPNRSSAGTYLCVADNNKTYAMQAFTVYFTSIPRPNDGDPIETIYAEENTSVTLKCKLPYKSTDTIRWFGADGELSGGTNEYTLPAILENKAGDYSCQVDSLEGSQAAYFRVEFGKKPAFTMNKRENETIVLPLIFGRKSILNCLTEEDESPTTVTWWRNEVKLDETSSIYEIQHLNESHIGNNRCEVKNKFGVITRIYIFKLLGCTINYNEMERNKFHPIIVTRSGEVANLFNQNGEMIVPESETLNYICPNSIQRVYCKENKFHIIDNTIPAEKRHVEYSDLKCTSQMEPSINTNTYLRDKPCSYYPESRLVQIGYKFRRLFYRVYEACIIEGIQQIYVRYDVNRYASDIKIGSHPFNNEYMGYDYDDMFDCNKQKHLAGEGCCFRGRQVVNPEDVAPAVQKTTYFNVNVLPQWNFCGSDVNFDEVDRRIRTLAKSIPYKVEVYAGELQNQIASPLSDNRGNYMFTPKFLWKVAIVREKKLGLAIITINMPNITLQQAIELSFCQDICEIVDWMQDFDWHNVSNGYTFCCAPYDFSGNINTINNNIFPRDVLLTKHLT